MSVIDDGRIRLAVWWYGAWLEYHGIRRGQRRELKRELRANLIEASAAGSSRQAVRDLGGVRALAAAVARDGSRRPRWQVAGVAAAVTFGVIVNVELVAALNYVEGVRDSGGGAVTGTLFPFPGSTVAHEPAASGFAIWLGFGWLPLAAAALVLVLVARPWRLFGRPVARARQPQQPRVSR